MRKLVIACLIQFALLAQAHAWGPEGNVIYEGRQASAFVCSFRIAG